jgi:CRP/FNR family transcriptional regulator
MLSEEQLMKVDLHRTEITFKKGETLCKQGSFTSNIMYLKSGLVKIYLESEDQPTTVSLETVGYFIGLPLIFKDDDSVCHFSVQAMTDSQVCMISTELIREFISTNHDFAQEVISILSKEVIKGHERMFSLTQMKIKGRFAELLMHLKDNIYGTSKMKMNLTRKDLGELISATPESVSRLIKELNEEEILTSNGSELHILDEDKLLLLSREID